MCLVIYGPEIPQARSVLYLYLPSNVFLRFLDLLGRLDSFISHYEELNYDATKLDSEHSRVKRETKGYNQFMGEPLRLSISTHGK